MKQSLICILDILGTKGIWTEHNIKEYFEIIDEIESKLSESKVYFESIAKNHALKFDFVTFSDSLIVTLINENRYDYFFDEAIGPFSQLILGIFQGYMANKFLLRGAISYGNIEKRGSHFIGPAVDDAAEYYEQQDMIGVCLTPKASIAMEYSIEWNRQYKNINIDRFLIKYRTPLKSKVEMDLYQINYIDHFFEPKKEGKQMDPFSTFCLFMRDRNIPTTAISKYNNSIAFFNHVKSIKHSAKR